MKDQSMTQKQWVFEQKHEKNQIKNAETDEERYASRRHPTLILI